MQIAAGRGREAADVGECNGGLGHGATGQKQHGALERPVLGSGTDLFLADFCQGLAINAQGGCRARFQTADADLDTARIAPAVFISFDQLHGFVDLLDQLALAITGPQLQAELFFLAGAVCWIWEVGSYILHKMNNTDDFLHQLQLPSVKDVGEVRIPSLMFSSPLFSL